MEMVDGKLTEHISIPEQYRVPSADCFNDYIGDDGSATMKVVDNGILLEIGIEESKRKQLPLSIVAQAYAMVFAVKFVMSWKRSEK